MSICEQMRRPVTLLTSREVPDSHPFADVVKLPRDDCALQVSEPTAHGALHRAPHHDPGMASRMDTIARWVADAQPEAVVVDVSVEVAVFVRLLGVPIIVMALPGERYDAPHLLVHRLADQIVAAWPKELCVPPWLRSYEDKTSYVGGISRFDGRQIPAPPPAHPQRGPGAATTVLILGGADGLGAGPGALEQCATAQQLTTWTTLGTSEADWTDDPWPQMCGADVVVTHAGQSCIADVAAAQRPAVIIPQPRPYDEQQATSRVLRQIPPGGSAPALARPARVARPGDAGPGERARQVAPMEHPRRGRSRRRRDRGNRSTLRETGAVVRTAMITTVHGRHEHLRRQIAGLRRRSWSADMHVVVALADPMIRGVVAETNSPAVVADCDYANGQLPVAQGRNIGATAALRGGAELLVFLEVAVYPAQR